MLTSSNENWPELGVISKLRLRRYATGGPEYISCNTLLKVSKGTMNSAEMDGTRMISAYYMPYVPYRWATSPS